MDWKIVNKEESFSGFFKLFSYKIEHELFNGGTGTIDREVLQRGHAAAVMPYDPATDSILLIEQFRAGVMHTEQSPWLFEVIAGMVEEGEHSSEVVRREAQEEAGLELTDVNFVSTYFPSPGGSAETIDLYWAAADLSAAGGVFGLDTEGEDIRSTVYSFDDAMRMLDDGVINNSVTMLLLLWFYRFRQSNSVV